MKAYWYFISSLPVLKIGERPPLDIDTFRHACEQALTLDERGAIDAALEGREPPPGAGDAWWNDEVQVRNAIVRMRMKRRGGDSAHWIRRHDGFSVQIETMVTDAFTRSNPLERELALDRLRWMRAGERAVPAPFGFPAILAYAVQLGIAHRWAGMEKAAGREQVEESAAACLKGSGDQ